MRNESWTCLSSHKLLKDMSLHFLKLPNRSLNLAVSVFELDHYSVLPAASAFTNSGSRAWPAPLCIMKAELAQSSWARSLVISVGEGREQGPSPSCLCHCTSQQLCIACLFCGFAGA